MPRAILRDPRRPHHRDRRRRHPALRGAPGRRSCGAAAWRQPWPTRVSNRCESRLDAGGLDTVLGGRYTEDRRSLLAARLERGRRRSRDRAGVERRGRGQAGDRANHGFRDHDQRALRQLAHAETASSSRRLPARPPTRSPAAVPSSSPISMCGCWRPFARTH